MPIFRVRQGKVPLFGVVEASNQEPFCATFADPAWHETDWTFDDDLLDCIADEFDEDLDGSAYELRRYCSGHFRSKTRGPGGNRLGTLGEAITWLSLDGPSGRLIRVVDWKPPAGKVVKSPSSGAPVRYAQPDFIERQSSVDTAVEVKSTEQLRFRKMLRVNQWQQLISCAGVYGCREAALEQIGFSGAPTPVHSLELHGGEVIPFPVGRGSAVAVLARDGRVDQLRSDPRFRTPPACRGATTPRDCWRCMAPNGVTNDLTIVRMDNAPDHLPVIGGGERNDFWARAYFQWSGALWSRDEAATGRAARELARSVDYWLHNVLPREADALPLLAFWGSYLLDAASQRGLRGAAGEEVLPTLAAWAGPEAWTPSRPEEPTGVLTDLSQLDAVAGTRRAPERRRLRLVLPTGSVVIDLDERGCEGRALDQGAHLSNSIALESAEKLAGRVAAAVLVGSGWIGAEALVDLELRVPLRKVEASLGESRRQVGWMAHWPVPTVAAWHRYARPWRRHIRDPRWRRFPVEYWLFRGPGPNLRVRVTGSGRATAACDGLSGPVPGQG